MTQLIRSTILASTKEENSETVDFSSKPWDDCSFLTMTGIKSTLAESHQVLHTRWTVLFYNCFVHLNK